MSAPTSKPADRFLGIDFGTTKTMVAEYDPVKGHPKVHKLGRGNSEMPTSIYMTDDGHHLFGDDADDEGLTDPMRYKDGFKMDLGESEAAADLTTRFLANVRHLLETQVIYQAPDRVILTVPAMFGPSQRKDLSEAARKAGFKEVELLKEPEAAGIAFCHHDTNLPAKVRFLVVDWGGGTFDVALVEKEGPGKFRIHENLVSGCDSIGGRDMDDDIWLAVANRLKADGHGDLDANPVQMGRNRREISRTKERLSNQESVRTFFSHDTGTQCPLTLNRTELEAMISDKVRRGVSFVTDVLERCRRENRAPEFIVLAGGTTRIPLVKKLLAEATGIDCRSWSEGRDAIAIGAALHAYQLWPPPDSIAADPQPAESSLRIRAGLNPMLRFRTRPDELEGLDLGHPLSSGSNFVYIHEGTLVTGVTKVFSIGNTSFGCSGMSYYYLHGSESNKRMDSAESIATMWGDYSHCEENLFRNKARTIEFIEKYPTFSKAMINSFLAQEQNYDAIDHPFFLTRINTANSDYALYVPFDPSVSVKKDLQDCNFSDVKSANEATQLLLRASMAIDNEIFSDESRFIADMLNLG